VVDSRDSQDVHLRMVKDSSPQSERGLVEDMHIWAVRGQKVRRKWLPLGTDGWLRSGLFGLSLLVFVERRNALSVRAECAVTGGCIRNRDVNITDAWRRLCILSLLEDL